MAKNRSNSDKMLVLEIVLENVSKIVKTMPPDTQKQWFRIGGVAFPKVSNTFKKLWKIRQKTSQNEPKFP